ncbi:MAG: hypothetical protein QOG54_837 [Actinomycetota bacterium]|nr:hypothetical protein [Actinomycetota bacterium]
MQAMPTSFGSSATGRRGPKDHLQLRTDQLNLQIVASVQLVAHSDP